MTTEEIAAQLLDEITIWDWAAMSYNFSWSIFGAAQDHEKSVCILEQYLKHACIDQSLIQPTTTLITGLLASIIVVYGWYWSARIQKIAFRNQHSYKYLLYAPENSELSSIFGFFIKIGSDDIEKLTRDDPKRNREFRRLIAHYEYLAISIRLGNVSEKFILLAERGLITDLFIKCSRNISNLRKSHRSRSILEHYEILFIRFYLDQPTFLQQFVEWLFGTKLFRFSKFHFSLQYRFMHLIFKTNRDPLIEDWETIKKYWNYIVYAQWIVSFMTVILILSYSLNKNLLYP